MIKVFNLKDNTPLNTVRQIISSRYFPFFTAAFFITCYYLGGDMVMIYYAAIAGIAMLLLLDDLTPLIHIFMFMNVMITPQHSPTQTLSSSEYFSQPAIYWQLIVLVALYVAAIFYRVFFVQRKSFRPTPIFWGLCVLALAFLMNGAGSSSYSLSGAAYGLFIALLFLVIFVLFSGGVKLCEENYLKIIYGFLAFSLLLVIELAVKYISVFDEFVSYMGGTVSYNSFKTYINFGWGIWNTMGMLLCLCIPAVFMLAAKSKRGFLWILYATALAVCALMSMGRQAMLGACFAYGVCGIAVLIKSRSRLLNAVTLGAVLLIITVVCVAKREAIAGAIDDMLENIISGDTLSGNGRVILFINAVKNFAANPLFGSGFYMKLNGVDFTNLSFIPEFAHQTFAEILGACGLFGIIAYCVHRIQTVVAFAQKPDVNKFYVAAIIVVMLLLSLIDNHIFHLLPTLLYSSMLVFAVGEEKEARLKFNLMAGRRLKKNKNGGEINEKID